MYVIRKRALDNRRKMTFSITVDAAKHVFAKVEIILFCLNKRIWYEKCVLLSRFPKKGIIKLSPGWGSTVIVFLIQSHL